MCSEFYWKVWFSGLFLFCKHTKILIFWTSPVFRKGKSPFCGEIHALNFYLSKISVQLSVSWCLLFASIVSVEWPVVGHPAWCHILDEKKVSTLSPNPLSMTSKCTKNYVITWSPIWTYFDRKYIDHVLQQITIQDFQY